MTQLNYWGTPIEAINPDEYCPQCEREVPYHYHFCPVVYR